MSGYIDSHYYRFNLDEAIRAAQKFCMDRDVLEYLGYEFLPIGAYTFSDKEGEAEDEAQDNEPEISEELMKILGAS